MAHAGRADPGSQGEVSLWIRVGPHCAGPPQGWPGAHAGRADPGSQGRGLIWICVGPHCAGPPRGGPGPTQAVQIQAPRGKRKKGEGKEEDKEEEGRKEGRARDGGPGGEGRRRRRRSSNALFKTRTQPQEGWEIILATCPTLS